MKVLVLVNDFTLCCYQSNFMFFSKSIITSFKYIYEMKRVVTC